MPLQQVPATLSFAVPKRVQSVNALRVPRGTYKKEIKNEMNLKIFRTMEVYRYTNKMWS